MAGPSNTPLGIIAGGGALPSHIIETCKHQKRPYTTVALIGDADSLSEEPALWVRLGEAAKAFHQFHQAGVVDVVMAGKVRRPGLTDLRPDWRTLKFLARAGTAAFTNQAFVGDDRLLRAVIAEFEREGFRVVGLEDVLMNLHVGPGRVGETEPTESNQADIKIGIQAARDLGREDVGQAIVVCDGAIVAQEGPEGTDALIRNVNVSAGVPPILVKTSKPQQDRRADLPVIGPSTIDLCVASGFGGVVVEAGGTLVLEKQEVARIADAAGMFVYAAKVTDESGDPT